MDVFFSFLITSRFKGGLCTVRKAEVDGVAVAVKSIDSLTPSDSELDVLHEEMLLLAQLKHPQIVLLLGCSEDPLQLVLEFVELGSLDVFLEMPKEEDFPESCRLDLMHQISTAMVYVHDQGVIHGNLSEFPCCQSLCVLV